MVAIKFLLLTTLLALGEAAAVQDKKPPKKPTEAQEKKIKAATEKFIKNKAVVKGKGGLGESKLSSNKDSKVSGRKFGKKCTDEQYDKDDDRFQVRVFSSPLDTTTSLTTQSINSAMLMEIFLTRVARRTRSLFPSLGALILVL